MIFKNTDPQMSARVFAGKNAIAENSGQLKSLGSLCLIITGRNSAKICGVLDDALNALEKEGIKSIIFNDISANPTTVQCLNAGMTAYENKVDFIFALGGGSVIDAAKAAAVIAANPHLKFEDIFSGRWNNKPIPLAVAGTTAGTGTEVSKAAVITDISTAQKTSITHPDCFAEIAFCDPKYTYTAGFELTVSTALDALAHASEGWFNKSLEPISKQNAKICLPVIWRVLKKLAAGETLTEADRDDMYYASLYAGIVLRLGTAYPHAVGYILTENYNVPHGTACAVFLPHMINYCGRYAPDILSEYLNLIGADTEEFECTLSKLIKLPEIKMSDAKIEEYAARWGSDFPKFRRTYGDFTVQTAKELLKELFGE